MERSVERGSNTAVMSEGRRLMAEANTSIFNKTATERLRSPDDLDRYVRVTNPSVWAVLSAVLALIFGLLAWGIFGSVSTSVETMGVMLPDGQIMCFLPAENVVRVKEGDTATVQGQTATVVNIEKHPYDRDEVKELLSSDYLVSALTGEDWSYMVTFKMENTPEFGSMEPLVVSITTERVAPISLVLG